MSLNLNDVEEGDVLLLKRSGNGGSRCLVMSSNTSSYKGKYMLMLKPSSPQGQRGALWIPEAGGNTGFNGNWKKLGHINTSLITIKLVNVLTELGVVDEY